MIKIFTVPHTLFAANHLVNQFNKLGIGATVVDSIDFNDNSLHIIYNAATLGRLPKNYVVMQTEISTSHWFTPHYMQTLRNAKAVWDYSISNIQAYQNENKNICIVSPGIAPPQQFEKDIDFLFYGWLEGSERRNKMVNQLQKLISVNVVTSILENDMWAILKRSRVVINIHYFDNSPLELYRINESLSHQCHVVSEGFDHNYKSIVDFSNDIEKIAELAINKSKKAFNYDLTGLDNTNQLTTALESIGMF